MMLVFLQDSEYPLVVIGVFIQQPTPFVTVFFERLLKLQYPKNRLKLLIYNQVYYRHMVVHPNKDLSRILDIITAFFLSTFLLFVFPAPGSSSWASTRLFPAEPWKLLSGRQGLWACRKDGWSWLPQPRLVSSSSHTGCTAGWHCHHERALIQETGKMKEEIKEEILLYLSENDNGEVSPLIVWDAEKAILRGKIVAKLGLQKRLKIGQSRKRFM